MSTITHPAAAVRIGDMTDSDFSGYLADSIRGEQEAINGQVTAGATLLRSGQRKIHALTCAYSGQFPTRRDAYQASAPSMERLRANLAGGKSPAMPVLITSEDVASHKNRYQRCGSRNPPVPDYVPQTRQQRNASQLTTALTAQLDRRPSAVQAAMLAVLRLHYAHRHACPADRRMSPCSTTSTILRTYGIKP